MKRPISFLAILVLVFEIPSLVASSQDGTEPYLVKGKFGLPLNTGEIREQWEAWLPRVSIRSQGQGLGQ